ncbi:lactococcin 972 family bacteriocin [Streptomyces sp. NPDC049577]|uniref:lactococcin 972 family bacteriocin n=1 Tax=Streptomyces sp. NPDC049577 TaxID=3155153 RepID=UPI0034409E84
MSLPVKCCPAMISFGSPLGGYNQRESASFMKAFGRSIALVATVAAVSAGVLISPASAAAPEPPKFLGHPKEWGEVTFTVDPSGRPTVAPEEENVGGGTWSYGTGTVGTWKSCYSNYVHPSKRHSSTASMGSDVDKNYADAGDWSTSEVKAGFGYTCHAYWAVY